MSTPGAPPDAPAPVQANARVHEDEARVRRLRRLDEALEAALRSRAPVRLRGAWSGYREAAVVLPLFYRREHPHVLLTRRPTTLRHHAGQISFPGGGREPADPSPRAAALRELEEELGVVSSRVRVLGELDETPTPTGFRVQPVVGVVDPGPGWRPSPAEVAEVIEIPMRELRAPGRHSSEPGVAFGARRLFHTFDWEGHRVWGLTAHLLHQLLEIVDTLPPWREVL